MRRCFLLFLCVVDAYHVEVCARYVVFCCEKEGVFFFNYNVVLFSSGKRALGDIFLRTSYMGFAAI